MLYRSVIPSFEKRPVEWALKRGVICSVWRRFARMTHVEYVFFLSVQTLGAYSVSAAVGAFIGLDVGHVCGFAG